jgi:hypothetical protein
MAVDPQKLRLTRPRDPLSLRTMKKILSLLLCYVFLQTETFALRGGPGGSGSKKLTGAYSGVLTQSGGPGLGLFLLNAINSGASNGEIVFFAQVTAAPGAGPGGFGLGSSTSGGHYFSGSVTGLSDPTSGTFYGLFNALTTVTTVVGAVTTSQTVNISGSMKLTVSAGTGSGNSQIITGTASAETAGVAAPSTYTVSGWQTSSDSVSGGFGTVTGSGS